MIWTMTFFNPRYVNARGERFAHPLYTATGSPYSGATLSICPYTEKVAKTILGAFCGLTEGFAACGSS